MDVSFKSDTLLMLEAFPAYNFHLSDLCLLNRGLFKYKK